VAEACAHWSLDIGPPYEGSNVSLVLHAERAGDPPLVLKLRQPDRESEHEAAALEAWDGAGAIRLIDDAPHLGALLLERCEPGTYLAEAGAAAALRVLPELLQRLAIPCTQPFTSLADEAQGWADRLPGRWEAAGRPFERPLIDKAVSLLGTLAGTQGPQVLVHQDLHGHNVLRAQREPWLAIDPKPLHGEIEFALAPVVRSRELGHSREAVLHRLDQLSSAMQIDRSRARDWCFAQTVAWSIEGTHAIRTHLDTARWLLTA
jgi:streptomycin 6-kinase